MSDFFQRCGRKELDTDDLLVNLEHWFTGSRSKALLESQQSMLDLNEITGDLFGYYLLQLSVASSVKLVGSCRVQKKIYCHPLPNDCDARCDYEQLPFETESLDVVVLHHSHEFIGNPHLLLREVQRVVIPNGRVIIMGFNPWSPMGLYRAIGHFVASSIWKNHLITTGRMKDWLSLLGFDTQQCYFGGHFPSALERSNKSRFRQLLRHWPLGNFYLISAIKQEAGITPLKPKWKQAKAGFSGLAPAKPRASSRSSKDKL